jgi:hypothetical protein
VAPEQKPPKHSILILAALAVLIPAPAAPPAGRALLISDIHFDPFADKALVTELIARPATDWPSVLKAAGNAGFARRGSDSNYSLMMAVLDAAAENGPYDYVIFQGDALRHHFRETFLAAGGSQSDLPAFAAKTAVFVARTLEAKFHAPVIFAVGNDDSTCDNYRMDPGNLLYRHLSNQLSALSKSPDAISSFRSGGYYSIPNPASAAQEIVVLNSVLWSPKFSTCGGAPSDPGDTELDWLASKLDQVQRDGRTAILVMHIPPGADVNASLGKCAETPMWTSHSLARFTEIVEQHRRVIQFALAGHTHRDDFRMLVGADGNPVLPFRILASVSPVYDNDPEFSVLMYAPHDGVLSDLVTYSFDLASNPPRLRAGYSWFKTFGIRTLDSESGASLISRIRAAEGNARHEYETHFAPGAPSPFKPGNFDYYACGLTTISESQYKTCVCH